MPRRMASSFIMNSHPLLMIIMLSCLATSHSQSIFDSLWGSTNKPATGQAAIESNSTIQPMIKLNLVGSNPSLANAFTINATNQQLANDEHFLNQFRINPQDIQFIVPNQPDQLGNKIVEQIQQQLGNKPISLAELKNKNLTFSVEMPGVQFNRTVQTNISDETIVRRSGSGQQNVGPYVMQSYMKKPPSIPSAIQAFQSNNYGKPIVYVTPESPNYSKNNYSVQAAVPTPVGSYSAPPAPAPPPLSAPPPRLTSVPPPVNYSIAATPAKPLLGYLQPSLPTKYPPPSARIFKASGPGNQSNTFIPPPARNYLTAVATEPIIPAEYSVNSYPTPAVAPPIRPALVSLPPPPLPPPPPPPKIINYTVKPLIGQLAQPIPLTDDSYLSPPPDPIINELYVVQSPEITKGFLAPPPLPAPPKPSPKTYVVNAPPPPPPNPLPLAPPPPPPPPSSYPDVSNYSAPQNSTKIFKMYQGSAIPAAITNGSQTLNYASVQSLPPPPPPPPPSPPSSAPPQKSLKTFVAQPKPSTAEPPTLFSLKKLQKPLKTSGSGYTPEQTNPQPKSELYISQAPPLLNPKSDYESYVKVAANQPEILYRYIEVCNGKPVSNYGDVYSNVQKNAQELQQAVESGYSEYSNMQSKLESSLSQLEHLKQMVQYYQNLVPYLSTYAQKYADVAAKSPQNPYQPIVVPQYPNLPSYPSTYQQQSLKPGYTVSASGSKPYQPYQSKSAGNYDNGQIKISYNSVEETLKTDSSALPDLIQVY